MLNLFRRLGARSKEEDNNTQKGHDVVNFVLKAGFVGQREQNLLELKLA